jgi:cytidine deaminase
MSIDWDALINAAAAVRANAYAPYSRYRVGAAVLGADGRIYPGCNIENASYGLCLCAERAAVAGAVVAGNSRIVAACVVTSTTPPAAPCGMCRQVLAELAGDDLPIALLNDSGEHVETTLGALLPRAFRMRDLENA